MECPLVAVCSNGGLLHLSRLKACLFWFYSQNPVKCLFDNNEMLSCICQRGGAEEEEEEEGEEEEEERGTSRASLHRLEVMVRPDREVPLSSYLPPSVSLPL